MSEFIYYILTVLMVLDCLLLILLVLMQLPKKEAGAGMAFGGGATDALFGAGSGTPLATITKYSAGIFFGLAILMAVVAAHGRKASGGESLMEELSKRPATPLAPTPLAPPSANNGLLQTPLLSNVPPAQTSAPATAPATAPTTNK